MGAGHGIGTAHVRLQSAFHLKEAGRLRVATHVHELQGSLAVPAAALNTDTSESPQWPCTCGLVGMALFMAMATMAAGL